MESPSVNVTKEFSFDAAHKLINYRGKCESLHGHTWQAQITVTGPLDKDGMVFDFTEMKSLIHQHIKNRVDHSYLNDIIEQPTAENIGLWIFEQISPHLPGITKIRVYESSTSFATLKF